VENKSRYTLYIYVEYIAVGFKNNFREIHVYNVSVDTVTEFMVLV